MSLQEMNGGPQLSAEGEALLRDVLERRAGRTRWEQPDDAPIPADAVTTDRRSGARWPTALGLLTIAGLALIAVAGAMGTNQSSTDPTSQPVAASAESTGLDPMDIGSDRVAASEPGADGAQPLPSLESLPASEPIPSNTPDHETPATRTGHIDLQIYASEGRTSSAMVIRIRQEDGEPVPTDALRFRTRTEDGAATDARVVFEQADLPASGSAIATVRPAEKIGDDTALELVLDTRVIASLDLPPGD